MYGYELDIVEYCVGVVVRVERLDNDDFLSRVSGYLHCERKSLASGYVDENFRYVEFYAAFFVVLLYQALAQRHKACGVAVGDVIEPVAGSLDRLQGTLRRLDVRSSDIEVVNLDARCFCGFRNRGQLPDGRCR